MSSGFPLFFAVVKLLLKIILGTYYNHHQNKIKCLITVWVEKCLLQILQYSVKPM